MTTFTWPHRTPQWPTLERAYDTAWITARERRVRRDQGAFAALARCLGGFGENAVRDAARWESVAQASWYAADEARRADTEWVSHARLVAALEAMATYSERAARTLREALASA